MGGDVFRDEYSLEFDGTDDYIEVSQPFSYTQHSVVIWAKCTVDDAATKILFDARDASEDGVMINFSAAERVSYRINEVPDYQLVSTAGLVGENEWIHIVATHNATQQVLYINGVEDQCNTEDTGPPVSTTANIIIGAKSFSAIGNNPFEGMISEVAIYSSALIASEAVVPMKILPPIVLPAATVQQKTALSMMILRGELCPTGTVTSSAPA